MTKKPQIPKDFHSSGASFVFIFLFSGILIFLSLMTIAFMGYVLPFGQMSFWGATVITNLLSPAPSIIEWICGGHYVYNPTLKRFFLFHFLLPFITLGLIIIHLFYLHFHSSNNPFRLNTNNKIPFFPFIFLKDFFGFILILNLGDSIANNPGSWNTWDIFSWQIPYFITLYLEGSGTNRQPKTTASNNHHSKNR